MNREQWLTEVGKALEPIFKDWKLGPYRVSCGWPSKNAIGLRSRVVGQCFGPETSKDGTAELFISPLLDDPLEVAGTLAHEMAHVVAGVKAKHGPQFVKVCRAVGLTEGKPESVGPGPILKRRIQGITESVGTYPHAKIIPVLKPTPKTTPRLMLKCVCGCQVSIRLDHLETYGGPKCGCGLGFLIPGEEEEGTD